MRALRIVLKTLAPAAVALTTPAWGCSIVPMTPEQSRQAYADSITRLRGADAILEVVVTRQSGENYSKGVVKIVRVLRGKGRAGQQLSLKTIGASLCGAGPLVRGQRGIIAYSAARPYFDGFLSPKTLREVIGYQPTHF